METPPSHPRFAAADPFQHELARRVRGYFEDSGRSRTGGLAMAVKVVAMLLWLACSWAALMFAPLDVWLTALLTISIGLAIAGVGFSVMHDANHGAAARSRTLNQVLSYSLDLVGASSVLWRRKHNVLHHTYTNVAGSDPDLEGGRPWLRLAPWQPHRSWHRFQHLYVWILYAVFPLKWWFVDDVRDLFRQRVRGAPLAFALLGKAAFISWAFAIPAAVHASWALVAVWAVALAVLGNVLAAVFQLAHCVGDADFVQAPVTSWARHQLATTADFAPRNRVLSWYLGGLNFQVEHHLFTRVCHVHYRALSRIIAETCAQHGVPHLQHRTLREALAANVRWLRKLGQDSCAAPATDAAPACARRASPRRAVHHEHRTARGIRSVISALR